MGKKKVEFVRVHPEFKKLIMDSDMTSRDFTKMLADQVWDDRSKKKKGNNSGGFVI